LVPAWEPVAAPRVRWERSQPTVSSLFGCLISKLFRHWFNAINSNNKKSPAGSAPKQRPRGCARRVFLSGNNSSFGLNQLRPELTPGPGPRFGNQRPETGARNTARSHARSCCRAGGFCFHFPPSFSGSGCNPTWRTTGDEQGTCLPGPCARSSILLLPQHPPAQLGSTRRGGVSEPRRDGFKTQSCLVGEPGRVRRAVLPPGRASPAHPSPAALPADAVSRVFVVFEQRWFQRVGAVIPTAAGNNSGQEWIWVKTRNLKIKQKNPPRIPLLTLLGCRAVKFNHAGSAGDPRLCSWWRAMLDAVFSPCPGTSSGNYRSTVPPSSPAHRRVPSPVAACCSRTFPPREGDFTKTPAKETSGVVPSHNWDGPWGGPWVEQARRGAPLIAVTPAPPRDFQAGTRLGDSCSLGQKMGKMWKMGWGEALSQAVSGRDALGRVQTPPMAVRGSPMARATPVSTGGVSSPPAGTPPAPGEVMVVVGGGDNNTSLSTTSSTGHGHGAGAKDCAAQTGQGQSRPKKCPQKGQKGGGMEGEGLEQPCQKAAAPSCEGSRTKPGSRTATAALSQISRSWGTIAPTPQLMLLSPPCPTKLPALPPPLPPPLPAVREVTAVSLPGW